MKFDQILLISLDTLRSDCINYNPQKLWPKKYQLDFNLQTDVLDNFAKKSVFFTNCISSAPYTSASHATIFTGKWPLHHGVYEFFNKKLCNNTIFSIAKKLGYHTISKVDFPIILGDFLGFTNNIDKYIIEDDQELLDSYDVNIPNFAFIHFGGMHSPYGFHNLKYGGRHYIQKVEELEAEVGNIGNELADRLIETFRDKKDLEMILRYKRILRHYYINAEYKKLFKLYLNGINFFIKYRFEIFFEKLLKKLRGKKYLILMFGDHGEEYDQVSCGHFNTVAEGVIRVPIMFYYEGIKPIMFHDRIRTVDIAPTLFEIMGYNLKKYLNYDGVSLCNFIFNDNRICLNKPCFSQAYISKTEEYVKFQDKFLEKNKKFGSLKHYRYREAVYLNNYKLTKQDYECVYEAGFCGIKPCDPIINIEIFDQCNDPTICAEENLQHKMLAQLEQYNLSYKKCKNKKITVPEKIKKQLMNLGYLNADM